MFFGRDILPDSATQQTKLGRGWPPTRYNYEWRNPRAEESATQPKMPPFPRVARTRAAPPGHCVRVPALWHGRKRQDSANKLDASKRARVWACKGGDKIRQTQPKPGRKNATREAPCHETGPAGPLEARKSALNPCPTTSKGLPGASSW